MVMNRPTGDYTAYGAGNALQIRRLRHAPAKGAKGIMQ